MSNFNTHFIQTLSRIILNEKLSHLGSSDLFFPEPFQWCDQNIVCIIDLKKKQKDAVSFHKTCRWWCEGLRTIKALAPPTIRVLSSSRFWRTPANSWSDLAIKYKKHTKTQNAKRFVFFFWIRTRQTTIRSGLPGATGTLSSTGEGLANSRRLQPQNLLPLNLHLSATHTIWPNVCAPLTVTSICACVNDLMQRNANERCPVRVKYEENQRHRNFSKSSGNLPSGFVYADIYRQLY